MVASIMEEMMAGTMVTVMEVMIMEEMEDITMEMDGTMAIIMVVQILDNNQKILIFRQLRPKTLNPQNDEVVCQTNNLLSDKTLLTIILHFTLYIYVVTIKV